MDLIPQTKKGGEACLIHTFNRGFCGLRHGSLGLLGWAISTWPSWYGGLDGIYLGQGKFHSPLGIVGRREWLSLKGRKGI